MIHPSHIVPRFLTIPGLEDISGSGGAALLYPEPFSVSNYVATAIAGGSGAWTEMTISVWVSPDTSTVRGSFFSYAVTDSPNVILLYVTPGDQLLGSFYHEAIWTTGRQITVSPNTPPVTPYCSYQPPQNSR